MEYNDPTKSEDNESPHEIFCGDLVGMEIAMPGEDEDEFQILLQDTSRAGEVYAAAKQATVEVQQESKWKTTSPEGHKWSFDKVELLHQKYSTANNQAETSRESAKKKQKHMRDLKVYTGMNVKTTNKQKFKGWSNEGKEFMVEMKKIKEDVWSGIHEKWEKTYRKICKIMKESMEKENARDSMNETYEVDYDELYVEVW